MSKLTRVLALGTLLAASNLAGSTALAHATDHAAIGQDGQRPPAERQVGEAWRHGRVTANQPTVTDTPRPPLERQVGESWRHHGGAAQPTQPARRPGWLMASLGGLAATVVLSAGLAVLAAKRAVRRVRVNQAT